MVLTAGPGGPGGPAGPAVPGFPLGPGWPCKYRKYYHNILYPTLMSKRLIYDHDKIFKISNCFYSAVKPCVTVCKLWLQLFPVVEEEPGPSVKVATQQCKNTPLQVSNITSV